MLVLWEQNLSELRAMYKYLPDYWHKLKDMQDLTVRPFRDEQTIHDFEIRFQMENDD